MTWKDSKKAFPDINCECLTYYYLPSKCKLCGADRTKNNWIEEDE